VRHDRERTPPDRVVGQGREPSLATALVVVSLIALNLRTAVVGVPPLLGTIERSLGLSSAVAGLLVTVPTLCFGAFAVLAPLAGRRLGLEPALAAGLALLAAGQLLRLAPGTAALFGGTLVAGIGAALGNVLLPAFVKRDFAGHVGLLTGTYTMVLTAGAALAAGIAVPVQHALGGWRPSLALWAAPAALALAAMLALTGHRSTHHLAGHRVAATALYRQPLAWKLTVAMGTQSLVYYSVVTWMPTVFEQHGASPGQAGWLLSLNGIVSIPTSLATPVLAVRLHDQRPLVVLATLLTGAGLLGLAWAPAAQPVLWTVLLGIGTSVFFVLVLTLIGLRSPDAEVASGLSSMAQSYGYLLAATGPFLVGLLHDLLGGWSWPLAVLAGMLALQCAGGLGAARPGVIERPRGR
jgi:CP family cyanate transporter-like MFS transporter